MALALDIGGTYIRSAIVNGIKIFDYKKVKTPKTKKDILDTIYKQIQSYIKNKRPNGIYVAVAGFQLDGNIIYSPNSDFSDVNLKELLEKKFKTKVKVENDASCAGLAELHYGQGKGTKNFVLLTLGTGIGGAIIINGRLYKGQGMAPEPGHMIINKREFEGLASGKGSIELAEKHDLKGLSSFEIEDLAYKKDPRALEVYKEVGHFLGIGMLNLSYILDPELIILGGGFSRVKFIYDEAIKVLHEKHLGKRKIKVVKARFGDDAGLIGAALLK